MPAKKTTVGQIAPEVLAYTAGKDIQLDLQLVRADCIGSAAHVKMLARMPVKPAIITAAECKMVLRELVKIMDSAERGKFKITPSDQDVHLAVERTLTKALGDVGKKVHTGRSRNDQVAVDLRLYAREQLSEIMTATVDLVDVLVKMGRKHQGVPMVGRTHMQKAMPSSVGLWSTAFAEGLLDDLALLRTAYDLNNRSPLGSAAGYGVPLPIDRAFTARTLGFSAPVHNVAYAVNARGKLESIILSACSQVMITLSRIAQDLMLYTMPEFAYFTLPEAYGTGSSIMPNKNNPDVMELMRAKSSVVLGHAMTSANIVNGAPTGYNRDLQETKEPFLEGLSVTLSSLRILAPCLSQTEVNKEALLSGFSPDVFATDRAIELVGEGMPFRDAYHYVKTNLDELETVDPVKAIRHKNHEGTTGGLDFVGYAEQTRAARKSIKSESRRVDRAIAKLFV